jgi:hypothetical protein
MEFGRWDEGLSILRQYQEVASNTDLEGLIAFMDGEIG